MHSILIPKKIQAKRKKTFVARLNPHKNQLLYILICPLCVSTFFQNRLVRRRSIQKATTAINIEQRIVVETIAGNRSEIEIPVQNITEPLHIDHRNIFDAQTKRFPIQTIVLIAVFFICCVIYISK